MKAHVARVLVVEEKRYSARAAGIGEFIEWGISLNASVAWGLRPCISVLILPNKCIFLPKAAVK